MYLSSPMIDDNYIRSSSKYLHLHLHHNSKEDEVMYNDRNGWMVALHDSGDSTFNMDKSWEIDSHTLEASNMKDLSLYLNHVNARNS